MTLIEWLFRQWDLVNWQTAVIGVFISILVAVWLFKLIAAHDKRALVAEKKAHEQTKAEKKNLAKDLHRIGDLEAELARHENSEQRQDAWREVELSDEEKEVLVAISKDRFNVFFNSKKMSHQRIRLAADKLEEIHFVGSGWDGYFAKKIALKWLDANKLLD